jgi:cell division protein FtsB
VDEYNVKLDKKANVNMANDEKILPMKIPVPMKIMGNGTMYLDEKIRSELGLVKGSEIYITIDKVKGRES